jgi:UDP-N-acetylmuramoyl-L-alanyl-D-glutamate--2,6-diaminopimelate ligase
MTDPLATGRKLGYLVGLLAARGLLRTVLAVNGEPPAHVLVHSVAMDSRRVTPGSLFVAIPGQHADGHDHVPAAVASGAVAVIAERVTPGLAVPQLLVTQSRPALAVAAAWSFDHPSYDLGVVGITGTDGKTTTAWLVRAMLEACGIQTGLTGTIDVIVGGRSQGNPGRATTPEATELQGHLAAMRDAGDRWAVVESTSHGLAQDRVGEIAYDVAVLTNITSEHLEFHGTLEAYRAAKRRLFEWLASGPANPEKGHGKHAILNLDDPATPDFSGAARDAGATVLTYGADPAADLRPVSVREEATGMRLRIRTPRWEDDLTLRLAGRFNVHNALAAIGVGEALGLDPARMRAGLASVEGVPGRMQRIDQGQPFGVIVDYAHTAESLGKVLDNLAPLAAAGGGGLIAVFGSAGDRDRTNRPVMGRVAAERCKLIVLTDEDGRSEDPDAILEEIAAGAERAGARRDRTMLLISDRREAIGRALELAAPGDVVVLAGKGHEQTIERASGTIAWDEAAAARDALAALGWSGRGGAAR